MHRSWQSSLAGLAVAALLAASPAAADQATNETSTEDTTGATTPTEQPGCIAGHPGSCCSACQTRARMVQEGKIKAETDLGCPCKRARAGAAATAPAGSR
jgi:hypothetical protein